MSDPSFSGSSSFGPCFHDLTLLNTQPVPEIWATLSLLSWPELLIPYAKTCFDRAKVPLNVVSITAACAAYGKGINRPKEPGVRDTCFIRPLWRSWRMHLLCPMASCETGQQVLPLAPLTKRHVRQWIIMLSVRTKTCKSNPLTGGAQRRSLCAGARYTLGPGEEKKKKSWRPSLWLWAAAVWRGGRLLYSALSSLWNAQTKHRLFSPT